MSRFQAQRSLGVFAPLDFTVITLVFFAWMTLIFWKIFGAPQVTQLILFGIANLLVMQVWIMVLVYRAVIFIADTQADINLMPEAAARIVTNYFESGAIAGKK